jgi:hypothetical protein
MFQRKPTSRFRRHNNRGHSSHRNGHSQSGSRPNSYINGQNRSSFRTTQSAEKLLEKYNTLAKEALTGGDKTLSENYLQHADHFMRVIEDKNKSRDQSKTLTSVTNETVKTDNQNLTESTDIEKKK